MEFDVILSIAVFIILSVIIFSYGKFEKNISGLFEDKKFRVRDAILMVALMGVFVTIIVFIPSLAIQVLFLIVYSYMMFSFVYILLKKRQKFVALFPPLIFIISYLFYPNLLILNIFAILFAIIISVYLGVLFSWKTTLVFAALLMVMDIIQVFITGYMIHAAEKMIGLHLPIAIVIMTFPSPRGIALGLGDIFLSGLLTIQTTTKYGKKAGLLVAVTISCVLFIFEVLLFNNILGEIRGFPATIIVILGWLAGIGIIVLSKLKRVL